MSPTTGLLTARGLQSDRVLPFLLIWYGWLSKKQGEVAKKRGLITLKRPPTADATGERAYLTQRGKRMTRIWLCGELDENDGYVFATHLRESGKVSVESYYFYARPPLGGKTVGFDWYHDRSKLFGEVNPTS